VGAIYRKKGLTRVAKREGRRGDATLEDTQNGAERPTLTEKKMTSGHQQEGEIGSWCLEPDESLMVGTQTGRRKKILGKYSLIGKAQKKKRSKENTRFAAPE